jgi:hypothetical protein
MHFWCRAAATLTLHGDFFTLRGLSRPGPACPAGHRLSKERFVVVWRRIDGFWKFARAAAPWPRVAMLGACATARRTTPTVSAANRAAVIARGRRTRRAAGARRPRRRLRFLSEGSKAVISLDNFKRRMSVVTFTAYRVDDASCDAESCKVQAKMTYDHRVMKGVTTPVDRDLGRRAGRPVLRFPPDLSRN